MHFDKGSIAVLCMLNPQSPKKQKALNLEQQPQSHNSLVKSSNAHAYYFILGVMPEAASSQATLHILACASTFLAPACADSCAPPART